MKEDRLVTDVPNCRAPAALVQEDGLPIDVAGGGLGAGPERQGQREGAGSDEKESHGGSLLDGASGERTYQSFVHRLRAVKGKVGLSLSSAS